jgi:hypothetical protein
MRTLKGIAEGALCTSFAHDAIGGNAGVGATLFEGEPPPGGNLSLPRLRSLH